jgi:hypothetical protein
MIFGDPSCTNLYEKESSESADERYLFRKEKMKSAFTMLNCVSYLYPRVRQGSLPLARPLLPRGNLESWSWKQPTECLGKSHRKEKRKKEDIDHKRDHTIAVIKREQEGKHL